MISIGGIAIDGLRRGGKVSIIFIASTRMEARPHIHAALRDQDLRLMMLRPVTTISSQNTSSIPVTSTVSS